MSRADSVIETGVDRLVEIVNEKKQISVNDAAKLLGVSPTVIEEWANFLEEEGIITLEYKLATTYLCEKKLSKKEILTKEKEYSQSKVALTRRVESALSSLDNETSGLDGLKKHFHELQDELSKEFNSARDQLSELETYEKLKRGVDQQIMEAQADFKRRINEIEAQVSGEKKKYQEMINESKLETIRLEEEKGVLLSLKDEEAKLTSRLVELTRTIHDLQNRIVSENKSINVTEENINYIQKLAKKLENEVNSNVGRLDTLKADAEDKENKIANLQRQIIETVAAKRGKVRETTINSEEILGKFKDYFERKSEIEKLINKVESEKVDFQNELTDLIKKAVAFNLASKQSDVKKHVAELEKRFGELEKKRVTFRDMLKKLTSLIKG